MKRRLWLAACTTATLAGCAGPTPADHAAEKPRLDLKTYFDGELVAHGIFTDRNGRVARRFTVALTGRWDGNQGTLSFTRKTP
jgi:hypothetical protein